SSRPTRSRPLIDSARWRDRAPSTPARSSASNPGSGTGSTPERRGPELRRLSAWPRPVASGVGAGRAEPRALALVDEAWVLGDDAVVAFVRQRRAIDRTPDLGDAERVGVPDDVRAVGLPRRVDAHRLTDLDAPREV